MKRFESGSVVLIGRKVVLLRYDESGAILEKIPVTITKLTGKGLWDNLDFRNWIAQSETGEEFTGRWWQNPSDQDFAFRMWDERNDKRGRWRPAEETG